MIYYLVSSNKLRSRETSFNRIKRRGLGKDPTLEDFMNLWIKNKVKAIFLKLLPKLE